MGFEPSLFTQQLFKVVMPTLYIEELLAYVVLLAPIVRLM
jgi:hypothetical protein